MYNYFKKDIRNLKTVGIKSIRIINEMTKTVILTIKYDKNGYPNFLEYEGLHGGKDHYELCMCRNYYKNDIISRRIIANSGEDTFKQYNYLYDNGLLVRTKEFEIGKNIILNSTTDYEYTNWKLTSIDTTYNGSREIDHISIDYKGNKTILIYGEGFEIIDKTDDGKLAYYSEFQTYESRYDFIYEGNRCMAIKENTGFVMELDIQYQTI